MQRIKSLLVIAVVMMAVQPVFGQKSSSDEDVRQLYRQAVDLYQKEKYAGYGPEGFAEAARAAAKDMIDDLSSVI